MAHYNKFNKIEMEILKDGEVIGYNYYFFKKDGDKTTVTNQIKFTVKLFGATIFEIEGYGEEKYIKDKLISFNSKTLQNNKRQISKIAKNAGISIKRARLLGRLANYFNALNILEIGTSLGIATASLSLANSKSQITTLEGCENTANIARNSFNEFDLTSSIKDSNAQGVWAIR